MKKLAILAFPLLLIFSGSMYAETKTTTETKITETQVVEVGRCSTFVLNDMKTGRFKASTTTCPGNDGTPGTVTKTFADGTTTVLQNGQIINLNK
jgi:hypothetical protein